MVKREKKSKCQKGGSFFAAFKTVIVPLFFLGANNKYKKRRKTAKQRAQKRRKIKKFTRKFKRGRRRR